MNQFDLKKFRSASFMDRTETLIFTGPGFAEWADDTPENGVFKVEWVVRGLTGEEVARVKAEHSRRKQARDMSIAAKNADLAPEVVEAFLALAGKDDLPQEYVRNLYVVRAGTVDPKGLTHDDVKTIAKRFPIEFMIIAEKIMTLTGLGGVDKKKVSNSGTTLELGTP